MVHSGNQIENRFGESIHFHQTSAETQGAFLEIEVTYRPHAALPPLHYHPFQQERFEVLAGAIHTIIDGKDMTYQPGEVFVVPANVPHAMHNISHEQGRVLWRIEPALGTEGLFEMLWTLARDGKTNANGVPSLLQWAVLSQKYDREFCLVKPPYLLLKALFAVLAPVACLLGYRASKKTVEL